jgi:hypothetical protein
MAFINVDEENQQYGVSTEPGTQPGGPGLAPLVGGASANVGAGAGGSAPTGMQKGGQGGWTNLQSYIGANAGDQGGASALKSTVGSEFDKEKQNVESQSGQYVADAQKQYDDNSVDANKAKEMLDSSQSLYSYDGQHKDGYQQNKDKIKGALTGQYSGPTSYQYGMGAQAQQYGQQLGDDQSFNKLMGDIYAKKSAAPLSTGQRSLQNQLDVHNTALSDERKNLSQGYGDLNTYIGDTAKSTTDKLGGIEEKYRTNQNSLRDYLTGEQNTVDQNIGRQEADARKAYAEFMGSGSGNEAIGYSQIMNGRGNQPDIMPRSAAGIWGSNLSWDQLQKENDTLKSSYSATNPYWYGAQPELDRRRSALQGMYGEQDAKYKDVADIDERRFNTLMDFIGSDGPRKEQGFKIRG